MTRRIFVTVTRGMTDKTAVCIFPWEKRLLESIHGGDVQEVSIDDMCSLAGATKIEKIKLPTREPGEPPRQLAPNLRDQLEAMTFVDPEYDPVQDPMSEYMRLVDKYGPDKDIPIPVVTRIFGEFDSGAFAAALKAVSKDEPQKSGKPIEEMSINELRAELGRLDIDFDRSATKAEMVDLLTTATA